MGTYASLFKERKSMIPEDKKEEFVSKVEKVFCDGGMMDMKLMRLFDKNIYTIQKASMQLDGMNVYYNYFEDDLWENAGFDIDKCCVWSNKIGWRQFYRVVVAAYVLEAQYTEGETMVMVDGEPVETGVCVGWLNYLFGDSNDMYCISPISTEKFFCQSADDMIIYWEEGCELEFSNELKDWFRELRVQYGDLLNENFSIDKMMFYIVELLEEANENYYNIYAFTGFVEETLENMQDKRYQVLWKIFDNMIHDPKMLEIGNVIFVPDEPKRRLTSSWCVMEWSKKNNKARMLLRRYMALMGNKELRCKIFGF
ncbi:MAG: hypothetical protein UEA60_03695 [Lachnospiraceae bacterium]|nr:hypothetical protein [Lachnospiraceae bacterium]